MKCPCFSQKNYEDCCKKYHLGQPPENALLLMRSRYSAYALNLAPYLMETTHPSNPHYQKDKKAWAKQILNFSTKTSFEGLDILEFIDGELRAFVTFYAHLKQNGHDASFKEKSLFEKVKDHWLYRNNCLLN